MRIVTVIFLALTALFGFYGSLNVFNSPPGTYAPGTSIIALITLLGTFFLLPGMFGVLKGKSWGMPVSLVGLVIIVMGAVFGYMTLRYISILSYILPATSFIFLLFSNKK